jgi:large conductance mechanosensitive channel
MGIVAEFKEFLSEYKVTGLAVAFVIGTAVTTFVQSFVNQVIMPVIGIFLPKGSWQTATVSVGGAMIGWGAFLSALINFIIIALVIFLIVRMLEGKGKKKGK